MEDKPVALSQEMDVEKKILETYPHAIDEVYSGLNYHIHDYYSLYVGDKELLLAALLANPFGITSNKEKFGKSTALCLEWLNKMQQLDKNVLKASGGDAVFEQAKLLFLAIQKVLFDQYKNSTDFEKFLDKDKVGYSSDLLRSTNVYKLKGDLEDKFFSYLEPEVYESYTSILKFSRENYQRYEEKISQDVDEFLKENGLNVVLASRVKTIASMHKKVIKRNILFSQVLDTVGMRILAKDVSDCYKTLSAIIRKWPVFNSRVKDYIALPKDDGYQSIHVTILYNDMPVEIQIRSFEMHHVAEYGLHEKYKQDDYIEL